MPCCSLEGARSWRRTHGAAVELGDGRASAVPGLLLSRRGRGAGSTHTGLLSCCRHAAVAAAGCLLVQPRSWARRGLAADPSLLLGVASKGRRPLLRVCTSLAAGALVAGPLLIAAWWREVKGGCCSVSCRKWRGKEVSAAGRRSRPRRGLAIPTKREERACWGSCCRGGGDPTGLRRDGDLAACWSGLRTGEGAAIAGLQREERLAWALEICARERRPAMVLAVRCQQGEAAWKRIRACGCWIWGGADLVMGWAAAEALRRRRRG